MLSRSDGDKARSTDVPSVLERALKMSAGELRDRARIVRAFAPVPRVLADEVKLGQVVMNLLSNAAYAIGAGDVDRNEIVVSTWPDGDWPCPRVRAP